MIILKQSTASQSIVIGPFVDSTDGVTPEAGLAIANTDIQLSKNGGTQAAKNSGGATADGSDGWYTITLDATDTNTVGRLQGQVNVSGALPVWFVAQVVEEAVYDAFYAASATNRVAGIDGTIQTLDALDTAQDTQHSTTQSAIATVDTVVDAILVDTGTTLPSTLSGIDSNVSAILTDTGTTLPATLAGIDSNVSAILTDTGTTLPATLAGIDSNVSAVLVDTGTTIPAQIAALNDISTADVLTQATSALSTYDPPTNAEMTAAFTEIKGATWSVTDTLEAIRDRGDAAWTTADVSGLATAVNLATVDANVDAILLDTGTTIPAQITALNNVSSADVNAACDTAISDAALATAASLATVSTNVSSILTDTGTTIPAQITALNDPTAAEVATAVLTTQMTESYATDGTAPTVAQALFLIQQMLSEKSITDVTMTVKKLDGSTTAATFTLNDGTSPTAITRSS